VTLERLSASLADRYRLERELGQGGMATVYLAADLKHDRKVALKVLRPELAAVIGAERFVVEIKTTAALQHPHILPLFDSGTADGFLYYVMPFIDGETLRSKLDRETQLGIEEAVKVTVAVADALDYAHRQGVVHRDIKPENILLHDGRPMVADFGIALALSAAAGGRMTETGLSLGTPHYMSPEQATAEKEITARSDVYSLGSVLYEMLTGNPPHVGASAQQIIMKIVTEDAAPVTRLRKSVPPNVAAAVAKALEKLPADRFDSAKAFADALGDRGFATTSSVAPAGAMTARSWLRQPRTLGLAAVALVASVVAVWGWQRRPPPPSPIRYRIALTGREIPPFMLGADVALSPDGRTIVFSDTAGGSRQLWIKAPDQSDPEVLRGGSGGQGPTFSPNGEWIAFVADGRVRKVPRVGGAAVTIADSASSTLLSSVEWLDNGTVAFVDVNFDVRLVDQDGGSVRIWTTARPWGAVTLGGLPGGKGVLVGRCDNSCHTLNVAALDFSSGEWIPVVNGAFRAWSLADGQVVFTLPDGSVLAAPFDADAYRFQSPPVMVLDGVRVSGVRADLALSHNGTLLFIPGSADGALYQTVLWVDRTGVASPVDSSWRILGMNNPRIALSPDGTRLAFSTNASGNEDVWIKELPRGALSRLTFGDSIDMRPRWTPDGRSVTFLSYRDSSANVYQRRADGTGTDSLLLDLEQVISEAFWSPDGHWLVLRTGATEGTRDIWALRVGEDTRPRPLLVERWDEEVPTLSPDGRWLAYVSNETGRREVFVRPFPEVESGKWQVSTVGGVSPVWAHSGRELFFVSGAGELVSQAVIGGAAFLPGEQRALFDVQGFSGLQGDANNYRGFDVSPDDQRFLVLRLGSVDLTTPTTTAILVQHWLAELPNARPGSR
jgi:Tol biopolymer transport system component/tRNA A-37 threonylcarbamoyl transferase component Bud32